MALQPEVGLGLRYNMPPGLSVPCCISPFVYTHLSQVHGHVIQPSHSWSSSSSCCIQLSVQHLFWDCGVLYSFYMPKPSYSLAFNKPDNVRSLNAGLKFQRLWRSFRSLKVCHPCCVRSITQSFSVYIPIYTYSHEHNNITISSNI